MLPKQKPGPSLPINAFSQRAPDLKRRTFIGLTQSTQQLQLIWEDEDPEQITIKGQRSKFPLPTSVAKRWVDVAQRDVPSLDPLLLEDSMKKFFPETSPAEQEVRAQFVQYLQGNPGQHGKLYTVLNEIVAQNSSQLPSQ